MTLETGAGAGARGRRRSHHACLNCRRKKTRCPGEKPACSSCVRLSQQCSYAPVTRPAQNDRSEERLAHLEEKLDFLLSSGRRESHSQQQKPSLESIPDISDSSCSPDPSNPDQRSVQDPGSASALSHQNLSTHSISSNGPRHNNINHTSHSAASVFDSEDPNLRPPEADIATGVDLYFKYCHRQPIWCFERNEVANHGSIPEELACSILALTARFTERKSDLTLYRESAKTLVMLRIANGTVELTTIESLCLLSYSGFIDGNFHLGQFHLGLAFQLCRTAMLDVAALYTENDPMTERKKRLFWSLQLLEQYYGRREGLLSVSTDIWRPHYPNLNSSQDQIRPRAPPLPKDELGTSDPGEAGIWNTSVHLAWVWSQVRKYVSNCASQVLTEPWRHDSMYAQVLSDFMETENRIPICHRYDTAKFYKRKVMELRSNRDYWAPWLKEQFTYHAIHTVLNHPFLYIVGAQHNPNLAIPNTFWRRSSELALLHATWIVRMIDMVVDKQVPLADPFFGHVAAIAATVHLYYCCATAPRLKHKSNADFTKCKRFLKRFIPTSAACEALDRNLDKMTRMAAGPEVMDIEDWMPSKIYLNVPLMWDILQFNFHDPPIESPTAGLLSNTLLSTAPPTISSPDPDSDDSMLEIVVATSPEISINTADGGQEAPTLSFKTSNHGGQPSTPWNGSVREEENLTFNFTPWLYADNNQFMGGAANDLGFHDGSASVGSDGMAWWEGDNFNNISFNTF